MRSKKEIRLNSDLIDLLEVLEKYDVKYMIIGGYAVSFHAEPRFTKDFDIWIATDRRNAVSVFKALAEFGAPLQQYKPRDFEDEDAYFCFGEYPNRIDVLMGPPGPKFASAWPHRIEADIEGKRAIFVGREALTELKRAAGRRIDKSDLRALAASSVYAQKPEIKTGAEAARKVAAGKRRKTASKKRG